MLVPAKIKGSMSLKLVEYDGMYLPELAGTQSGESGHPGYQHPSRIGRGLYGPDVDSFSQLLINTALRGLQARGRRVWGVDSPGDILLLRRSQFPTPRQSQRLHDR